MAESSFHHLHCTIPTVAFVALGKWALRPKTAGLAPRILVWVQCILYVFVHSRALKVLPFLPYSWKWKRKFLKSCILRFHGTGYCIETASKQICSESISLASVLKGSCGRVGVFQNKTSDRLYWHPPKSKPRPEKTATCSNVVYIAFTADSCPDFHGCLGVPNIETSLYCQDAIPFSASKFALHCVFSLPFEELSSKPDFPAEMTIAPVIERTRCPQSQKLRTQRCGCDMSRIYCAPQFGSEFHRKPLQPWNLQDSSRGSQDWPRVFCLDRPLTYCKIGACNPSWYW